MILTDICFILRIRAAFLPHLKEGTPVAILLKTSAKAMESKFGAAPQYSSKKYSKKLTLHRLVGTCQLVAFVFCKRQIAHEKENGEDVARESDKVCREILRLP